MKKKILHVSAGGLGYGGVGSVIMNITVPLAEEFEFYCAVFNKKNEREQEFAKYGTLVRINCYPEDGKRNYKELITRPIKLYRGIRHICREQRIDVVHCHNQYDAAICLLAAKHEHVPIRIAHSHVTRSSAKRNYLENSYKNFCARIIDKVANIKIGCSENACKQFYIEDDYVVVPNSIDLNRFNIRKRKSHEGINFIHVGRFNHAKNQEFVLEIFAEIVKSVKNSHLFLVGHGPRHIEDRLLRQINELNIEHSVSVIPGDKSDVLDYYSISDYMIFPSRYEGFGIALLEAQALEIQCFASDNVPEEVNCGYIDYISLENDASVWAERIADAMKNSKRKFSKEKLQTFDNLVVAKTFRMIYNGKH